MRRQNKQSSSLLTGEDQGDGELREVQMVVKTREQLMEEIESLRHEMAESERESTERKWAEEKLREAEQKWVSLTENTSDFLTIVDSKGTIQYINRAIPPNTVNQLIGKTIYDFATPEYHETLRQAVAKVFQTGEQVSYKNGVKHAVGILWFDTTMIPITREEGKVLSALLFSRGITEQKHTEEALHVSEEKLKQQYKSIPVPTYTWQRVGGDLELIDYNDAAMVITQASVANYIGKKAKEMYQDRPDIVEELSRCLAEKTLIRRETPYHYMSTGESKHLAVSYVFVPPDLVMVHTEDITELKRAEQALKESEERYRGLFENSIEAAFTLDLEGNITSANKALGELLGYDSEELVGMNWRKTVPPEGVESISKKYNKLLRTGKPIRSMVYESVRKDGERRLTEGYVNLIRKENRPVGFQGTVRDITERKQAEVKLRESEALYSALVNQALDGIVIIQDEVFRFVNRAFAEMVGYGEDELLGKPFRSVLPPGDRDLVMERHRRRMAGEDVPSVYETRLVCKDGTVMSVEVSTGLTHYQGCLANLTYLHDITERKQAEEALKQSEGNYRALFESAVIGTFVIDAETMKVVMGNQAAAKAFGFNSVEEAIGMNPLDLIPPDDRERVFEIIAKDMFEQDLQQTNEFRVMTKDGREVWISAVGTRMEHQGKLAGLVSFADITERKQAGESLKESEERYRGLFENSIEAVFTADLDGNITSCNRALEELIGYTWEELSKMKPVENIAPESSEFVLEKYRKLLNTGDPIRNLVYETIRKDGQRRIVEGYVTAVKKKNRIVGFQGTFRDTTERKRAEEALRESEERYSRLYHGINEAVALYRLPDLKISHWNKRYEDIHKLLLTKDIEGVTITDIAPVVEAEDWDRAMKGVARVLAGEPMLESDVLEVMVRDLEGNRRVIEIRPAFYKESGEVAGVQVAMADITERKRAEEALQASEEKWRSLAQNAPNIIVIVNRDGKIEFVNRTVPPITVGEAAGKSIYDYMEPQYRNTVKETIEHVFKTGGGGGYEVEGVGPDGRISWYETQAGPIKRDGRVVAVTLIITNVTKRKNAEEQLKSSFINLAETISRAIESRDPYTAGHQRRVAKLARLAGEKMGLDGDRLQGLYIGGLLHDIGKVSIPASILTKMGELTEEEWALICSHPKQGYNILKDTKLPWPVADMTLHHHERLDGSGYPHGISGDALSLEVRILAVCDVVEAMGSYRPYRPARTKKEVLAEIKDGRGTKYDAGIVDGVLQIIENGEFEFAWNSKNSRSTATKVPVP